MNRRHEWSLHTRLEDAFLHGCSQITWEELYLWYEVRKIAAGTWRDIARQWEEVTNGKGADLMKIETTAGICIFAANKMQRVDPDEPKFKL